jgi:OOP family OmpA-OmpF porin
MVISEAAIVVRQVYTDRSVLITGHCDTAEQNPRELGLARAERVRQEMIRLGVAADKIRVQTKGADDLMIITEPGVRQDENRRVIIQLIK